MSHTSIIGPLQCLGNASIGNEIPVEERGENYLAYVLNHVNRPLQAKHLPVSHMLPDRKAAAT